MVYLRWRIMAAWLIFILCGTAFVFVAAFNLYSVLRSLLSQHGPSLVPFLGGVLGVVAFAASPLPSLRDLWWLPLLLDVSFPLFLVAAPMLLKDGWRTSRWNLLRAYVSKNEQATVQLQLFRGGTCILRMRYNRQPGELGVVAWSMPGRWSEDGDQLTIEVNGRSLSFAVLGHQLASVSGDPELVEQLTAVGPLLPSEAVVR